MHYLVTGGAGFIGSHLVDALLARGDAVTVLDDCSTGSLRNLAAVSRHARLTILHGSVCDEVLVDEACAQVDTVIHLAAAVGVKRILDRQVASIVTNLRGTEVMLRAAQSHGSLPFLLASTSEIYGKLDRVPFREDDDSMLGASSLHRWSYACSKLMDEFLALAYHRERGLPVTIARFFNVTGPRQSAAYGMVLPRFCAAATRGDTLEVHGDGAQSRCFLHVRDAVAAILALLGCPAVVGKVVNIGSTEEVTMRALAERVVQIAASKSTVRLIPYAEAFPQGGFEDMRRRVPDVTRLRTLTSWTQTLDLDATIRNCFSGI
ncbi:MAG TPA: NAD-dependent epimerase/dehydratase family protein [Planctomycetota bacterium]|nr:NAD-dependent epimerase/dehydratase family protein [Planctomycetota bacterium]